MLLLTTGFGRRVIATGSNPVAARMSGIDVDRLRFGLFAAVGVAGGLAAVLLTARLGSTRPSIARGWNSRSSPWSSSAASPSRAASAASPA